MSNGQALSESMVSAPRTNALPDVELAMDRMMAKERRVLERVSPSADGFLASRSLEELESTRTDLAGVLRQHRLASLVVPTRLGGHGLDLVDAIRVQRAIGARSPSLAIMSTMHGFSCACIAMAEMWGHAGEAALRGVAERQSLVASGFAEGRSGAAVFDTSLRADAVAGGYVLSGKKKPCSISRSFDVLTTGVAVRFADGVTQRRGVAMVMAGTPGISQKAFWRSPILLAAESHELILDKVFVPESHMFVSAPEDSEGERMRSVENLGQSTFQLFAAASYVGVATNLVARVLAHRDTSDDDAARLTTDLEGAMLGLEGAARVIEHSRAWDDEMLRQAWSARFAAQSAVQRVGVAATELLGGIAFINDFDVRYLSSTLSCLAFHPANRQRAAKSIAEILRAGRRPPSP